jgi:hypothetical protein
MGFLLFDAWQFMNHVVIHLQAVAAQRSKALAFVLLSVSSELPRRRVQVLI